MEARARQYSSIKSIFALLTVNLLALGTAEYVHRHQHGIQSKTYEHPRFGDSSIRYCAFNQYFDDREGRCMIIPGGGIAISIDESTTCSTEALRGHPYRSRNYYICRKTNTILAECGRGKRFENRLKRCTIDVRPSIDEEDYDSHHHPYDHLHLPACQRSGRFPVPQDNCTSFYACTSNGFRFFRSIHKCPASTGFDPFNEICTTERACSNDEPLGSTTVADDRPEIFGSTTGLVVATAARPQVDEMPSIHMPKENYSLNKSTTRFTTISASPSPSTSGYDETKISVSFISPDTFTTEKITTATSLPGSIDEVVGIARATRPATKVYEHGGETSPFTSTTYVHAFGLSEQAHTSERSPITDATNEIVDTSTAYSVLPDYKATANTSGTIDGIPYNTYSDDYVTWRSDNTVRQGTKNESSIGTPVTILTNNKNDEFTDQTTIDDRRTSERDETRTSGANELGIGLQVSYSTESAMDKASEKWLFDNNTGGITSTIGEEIPRREITERELGTLLPVLLLGATSDATTRDIQYTEAQSITTPSGISSIDQSSTAIEGSEVKSTPERITLYDAVTLTTPVDSYASSGEVSWNSLTTDGIGDTSIGPTETVDSAPVTLTSPTPRNNEATSIQESNWTTEEESKIAGRYHDTFSSFSTDTPDNEKSTTVGTESAMNTTAYISEVTEKLDTTPVTLTSLTSRNNEATSIEESNWTTEEESTIADRYHDTFRSFSTDTPDNEKSTIDGAESVMSTTEPTYITEVTENFYSTPVTLTSLKTRNNEATSIEESNWTTEEESTIADRYHDTFRSLSTDTPDNEKSTIDGAESVMSTTEPTYITEVTENFYSTPVTLTSLTLGNNEVTSTTEPAYNSEQTEKFYSTPVSPTSLSTLTNEATSIQESNWTTGEESTIADRYHDTFRSLSTDTPDNEKSTTDGAESAMSTTEPTYITEVTENFYSTPVTLTSLTLENNEVTNTTEPAYNSEQTEKFDSTPVSLTSLTTLNNEATSIQDSNWTTEEESTIADRYHDTFTSFSTDSPDNEKSTNAGTESVMSTTDPVHNSEVTEKAVTHPMITWNSSSTDDLFTSIEQHESTTGENSYSAFIDTGASGASQFGIAQTTEDSASEMNVAVSTTSMTPSLSSEPSQLEDGEAQGSYTTFPYTFTSFSTDSPDNEKSTNTGTESVMSTTDPVHISELTEKAVTHPTITWNSSSTDDLFTSIEQHQSTTGENSYSAFTYTNTLGASQFGIAQTTGDSDLGMNVVVSTTSITPSLSSEPSQLEDGQAQASYISASNSSEYPTTVEPSAGSTNSLSTIMPSSSD